MSNCAQCGRDISSESFRYETEDDRILCEACFRSEEAAPEPYRPRFGFLRGMVGALRIVAFVSFAGGAVLAQSSYGYNAVLSAGAAICGIVISLVCIIVSEIVRLGLSIESGLERISMNMDRIIALRREQEEEPAVPSAARRGEEP